MKDAILSKEINHNGFKAIISIAYDHNPIDFGDGVVEDTSCYENYVIGVEVFDKSGNLSATDYLGGCIFWKDAPLKTRMVEMAIENGMLDNALSELMISVNQVKELN